MFDAKELESLDEKYFIVIYKDPYDVTIRSKNTGHFWSLHDPNCPETRQVIIFHSHHADRTGRVPFHLHGRAGSLRQAVKSIKGHDRWQLAGRPIKRNAAAGV